MALALRMTLEEFLRLPEEEPALELRTTFGGRSYVPDIAVYRSERLPSDATGRLVNDAVPLAPDIAVEIVSPGQRVGTLIRKCLWYVANGVPIALLVDADDESVLEFRPGQAPVARHGGDLIDVAEVLPRFRLSARNLFKVLAR